MAQHGKLYTGAFILCATDAYGRGVKYLNHIELLKDMFVRGKLGERILEASSLEEIFTLLRAYPLIGDFMAYQLAIDVNYLEALKFSENDFTQPGPGAVRGIRKVFDNLGSYTSRDVIMWMVDRQEREFEARGLPFSGLGGRPLHAIDCQGLFCEVDKYCREALPGLRSARKRIKARFVASPEPMEFFFPPKWGVNESLSQAGAAR